MELSIEQVAEALDLPVETVERWVRQGRIPFQRQQGDIHFRQRVLEKWATQHKLPFHVAIDGDSGKEVSQQDNIHVAMRRGGVFYDLEGADTEAVLQGAVQRLTDTELDLSAADQEVLLKRLLEREAMASTGVGKGVAIPHPRTPLETAVTGPTISTFFLKSPLPFQAIDDRPVFVLFILLSPSINTHLHCLSRLAFCVRDDAFVSLLQSRPAPQALYERVAAFEQQLDTL
jgi:PTS system nitrogen regulatory IIA component